MRILRRTTTAVALALAIGAGCRVGYEKLASSDGDGDSGGSAGSSGSGTGDAGQAGEGSGGTMTSGGTTNGGSGSSSGGSSTGGTIGEGGASSGGASGESTGGSSGASGTSGAGGSAGAGTGGGAGSGGCSPTNGSVEICDGVDNDCGGGVDDGVTCPATCRGIAYDGNGYMFCDAEPSYSDADISCTTLGMHLVKIDSAEENDFVASTMFGTNLNFIWLGGDDIATEGSWAWHDGTVFWTGNSSGSAPAGTYTNWYPGYPGGNNADCLEMRDDATWNDKQCSQGKRYVCELLY